MKILLIGSDGFIGRQVRQALGGHEVVAASVEPSGINSCYIDLLKPETIEMALREVKPEVVITAAGIVENTDKAQLNVTFTTNLLEAAVASGLSFRRLITTGSAGEYGEVKPQELPVSETTPLRAESLYGRSKVAESQAAFAYRRDHHLPVVVARVFNPIGVGMHPRMLIPSLIRQLQEIKSGGRTTLEVNRLDARRDYVAVRDIATAYRALVEGDPQHEVYNVGSGHSTSNAELIELVLKHGNISSRPAIVETAAQPEPLAAVQADISRLSQELGWHPEASLEQTIKELFDASQQ